MKNMGADGLLDELREVALFHTLGAQKGAQGEVGLLRYFDVPADCFSLHNRDGTPTTLPCPAPSLPATANDPGCYNRQERDMPYPR